jgi:hypothetical protein
MSSIKLACPFHHLDLYGVSLKYLRKPKCNSKLKRGYVGTNATFSFLILFNLLHARGISYTVLFAFCQAEEIKEALCSVPPHAVRSAEQQPLMH